MQIREKRNLKIVVVVVGIVVVVAAAAIVVVAAAFSGQFVFSILRRFTRGRVVVLVLVVLLLVVGQDPGTDVMILKIFSQKMAKKLAFFLKLQLVFFQKFDHNIGY
jgi:hypothetical protein